MSKQAQDSLQFLKSTLGQKAVNALYPNEVEVYITAFELVNSLGRTVDYFIFPINPSSVSEVQNLGTNIKKTAGGISVLNTISFIPTQITLNGDFGRQFKFILGQEIISFAAMAFSTSGGIFKNIGNTFSNNFSNGIFSKSLKTGYGCIKMMEAIILKTKTLDQNNLPYSLYFYNLSLGNNYLIQPNTLTLSMSEEKNMIWRYSLNMTSLAPLDAISTSSKNELTALLSFNESVQKGINNQIQELLLYI